MRKAVMRRFKIRHVKNVSYFQKNAIYWGIYRISSENVWKNRNFIWKFKLHKNISNIVRIFLKIKNSSFIRKTSQFNLKNLEFILEILSRKWCLYIWTCQKFLKFHSLKVLSEKFGISFRKFQILSKNINSFLWKSSEFHQKM